jgi:hypothetical protein
MRRTLQPFPRSGPYPCFPVLLADGTETFLGSPKLTISNEANQRRAQRSLNRQRLAGWQIARNQQADSTPTHKLLGAYRSTKSGRAATAATTPE